MAVRRKYARAAADHLIQKYGVYGREIPVEEIAVALGATVHREPASDDLSGFIYRDAVTGSTIIGINGRHHVNRQRFTLAHELAHVVLHAGEPVHWDDHTYGFRFRREKEDPEEASPDEEVEANIFAAELLMPERFLERDLAEYGPADFLDDSFEEHVLQPLARQYKVSKQAMTIRLKDLGYIVM